MPTDEQDLVRELLGRQAPSDLPYGVYLLWADDPAAELARSIERQVFSEFFGNSPELLAAEYDRFDPVSLFLLIVDHVHERPAGMIRVLTSAQVNKTLEDIEAVWNVPFVDVVPDLELALGDRTWDIATLAVAPGYRRSDTDSMVSAALYQAVCMLTNRNGIRWVTATLDLRVLELIQTACGEPFGAFAGVEPRTYLDSPASLPVYCEVFEFQVLLELTDPVSFAFLFECAGLEAMVSTPEWQLDRDARQRDEVV